MKNSSTATTSLETRTGTAMALESPASLAAWARQKSGERVTWGSQTG